MGVQFLRLRTPDLGTRYAMGATRGGSPVQRRMAPSAPFLGVSRQEHSRPAARTARIRPVLPLVTNIQSVVRAVVGAVRCSTADADGYFHTGSREFELSDAAEFG